MPMSIPLLRVGDTRPQFLKHFLDLKIKRRALSRSKLSVFDFVIRELSVSGFQYGHHVSQWNRTCIPSYLFLYFSLSHLIFNLSISFSFLRKAVLFIRQLLGRGARLLCAEGHHFSLVSFLGNSLFRDRLINGFLSFKWLGGTLTNWSRLVKKTLKEVRRTKILSTRTQEYVYSLRGFKFLPNVFFLFSSTTAPTAILEANRLAIPTVGVVDSDAYAPNITYPVFGNDNSPQSLYYLLFLIASAKVASRFRRFKRFGFLIKRRLVRWFCAGRVKRIHEGLLRFFRERHALAFCIMKRLLCKSGETFTKRERAKLAILAIRKEVHKLAIRSRVYGILKNRKIVIALKRLTRIIRLVFGSSTFGFIFPRKSTRRFARRSRLCRGLSVFMYNAQNYNLRLNGIRTRRFVLRAAALGVTRGFRKALASIAALSHKMKYKMIGRQRNHKGYPRFNFKRKKSFQRREYPYSRR